MMAAESSAGPDHRARPLAVLVVEDDDELRAFLRAALEDDGFTVLAAPHGAAALALLRRHPRPDVVLLDLRLPVLDGAAFARAFRRLPESDAPLVVLTAADDAGRRAAEVGAAALLRKPVDLDALLAVIRTHAAGKAA
jgi:CheY-like chemotaxis protein